MLLGAVMLACSCAANSVVSLCTVSALLVSLQDAVVMFLGAVMLACSTGATANGWVIMYAVSQLVFGIGVGGECPLWVVDSSAAWFYMVLVVFVPGSTSFLKTMPVRSLFLVKTQTSDVPSVPDVLGQCSRALKHRKTYLSE